MRDGPLLETTGDGMWALALPQGLSSQTDPVEISTSIPGDEVDVRRRRSIERSMVASPSSILCVVSKLVKSNKRSAFDLTRC
jgi:hypothetical protein